MDLLVIVAAASGIVTFAAGLPPLRRPSLQSRLEPFVGGGDAQRRGIRAWALRDGTSLAERLAAAGSVHSPSSFRLRQLTWAAAGAMGALLTPLGVALVGGRFDLHALPLLALLATGGGFVLCDRLLTRQGRLRRDRLVRALPTTLDLLTLSLMSGAGVAESFRRVESHLSGDMAAELHRTVADMRSGATIVEALSALGERIPDPAIVRFVDALVTAVEKGAPLAEVLLAQADDGREATRRRLLEVGGRREILMLVPVVFLILPVVVAFALIPGLASLDLLVG